MLRGGAKSAGKCISTVFIFTKTGSRRHPMDVGRRAKQFAPFAALKGFEDAVREKEIIYEPRRILSEERKMNWT